MAQLKDTLITGDCRVTGKVIVTTQQSTTNKISEFNGNEDIMKVEFARQINCNVLNQEITLFTVPEGYVCIVGEAAPSTIWLSHIQATNPSVQAELTVTFTEYFGSITTRLVSVGQTMGSYGISIYPWLPRNSEIKVKVTTAGVGFTDKTIIMGTVFFKKIGL